MLTMYQCRFMDYSQSTTVVWVMDSGAGYACVKALHVREFSVLSALFCVNLKTMTKSLNLTKHMEDLHTEENAKILREKI